MSVSGRAGVPHLCLIRPLTASSTRASGFGGRVSAAVASVSRISGLVVRAASPNAAMGMAATVSSCRLTFCRG